MYVDWTQTGGNSLISPFQVQLDICPLHFTFSFVLFLYMQRHIMCPYPPSPSLPMASSENPSPKRRPKPKPLNPTAKPYVLATSRPRRQPQATQPQLALPPPQRQASLHYSVHQRPPASSPAPAAMAGWFPAAALGLAPSCPNHQPSYLCHQLPPTVWGHPLPSPFWGNPPEYYDATAQPLPSSYSAGRCAQVPNQFPQQLSSGTGSEGPLLRRYSHDQQNSLLGEKLEGKVEGVEAAGRCGRGRRRFVPARDQFSSNRGRHSDTGRSSRVPPRNRASGRKNQVKSGGPRSVPHAEALLFGGKTSLMIKNIPNCLERHDLLRLLDQHCRDENRKARAGSGRQWKSEYDFLYLPMDFKTRLNLGYAFVNFTNPVAVTRFFNAFNNYKWQVPNSKKKICQISAAVTQGKNALIRKFRGSTFPCHTNGYLPVALEPARDGVTKSTIVAVGRRSNAVCGRYYYQREVSVYAT